jgi:hypothetical protein
MVEMKFNPYKIISHYYNNKFIKTPNLWLFHITKIYTLDYNVKKSMENYNLVHYIFDITKNSHKNMDMGIVVEVCTFRFY